MRMARPASPVSRANRNSCACAEGVPLHGIFLVGGSLSALGAGPSVGAAGARWEQDAEARLRAGPAEDKAAAFGLDEGAGEGQADAPACGGLRPAAEQIFAGDRRAGPFVGDVEGEAVGGGTGVEGHGSGAMLGRVGDEDVEDLAERGGRAVDGGEPRLDDDPE